MAKEIQTEVPGERDPLSHKEAKSGIVSNFCSLPFPAPATDAPPAQAHPDYKHEVKSQWLRTYFLLGEENNPLACLSHSVLGFLLVAAKYIPTC